MKAFLGAALLLLVSALPLLSQTCMSGPEADAPTRRAVEDAARQYFQMAQQGNTEGLRNNAIASVATNFAGIANAVDASQASLEQTQASIRSLYLLDNTLSPLGEAFTGAPRERVEFYCGIFNSPDRVGFVFNNLPRGSYAVVIADVTGSREKYVVSFILQQEGTQWKLAGFYPKATSLAGRDADWFWNKAREFKAKKQNRNAWLFYLEANSLLRPFGAMTTPQLDRLYDEMQQVSPPDFPLNAPVDLALPDRVVKVTEIFLAPVGDELDVVVKYQLPDISDSAATFRSNTAVINALVRKYPEFRDVFGGVVARAVDPEGRDYGTLLAMKDVK